MHLFRKLVGGEESENLKKLRQIEHRYNFKFPPLFLKFQSTYKTGQYSEIWDAYLDKFIRPTPMYEIKIRFKDRLFLYGWLCSPNQIYHGLKYYDGVSEMLKQKQLLRIGDIVQPGGIFIGVGDHNKDQIFKSNMDEEAPIKLCDTISEFLERLTITSSLDYAGFYKPVSSKYWMRTDVTFEIKKDTVESMGRYNIEAMSFSDAKNLLDEIRTIANDVQNTNS